VLAVGTGSTWSPAPLAWAGGGVETYFQDAWAALARHPDRTARIVALQGNWELNADGVWAWYPQEQVRTESDFTTPIPDAPLAQARGAGDQVDPVPTASTDEPPLGFSHKWFLATWSSTARGPTVCETAPTRQIAATWEWQGSPSTPPHRTAMARRPSVPCNRRRIQTRFFGSPIKAASQQEKTPWGTKHLSDAAAHDSGNRLGLSSPWERPARLRVSTRGQRMKSTLSLNLQRCIFKFTIRVLLLRYKF
jgi:hypothetical protein